MARPGSSLTASRKCASASSGRPFSRKATAQPVVELRVLRSRFERLLEVGDGFVPPGQGGERGAEVGVRLGRAGVEGERATVAEHGLLELALLGQHEAQLGRRGGALRLGGSGRAEEARRFVHLPFLRERAAQEHAGLGGVRLDLQGPAIVGDGPVEVAPPLQETGQLKVRALVPGTDGDRLPGRGQGRLEVAFRRRDLGHLQMAVRESRPLPEHLLAEVPGLGVLLVLHELVEPLVLSEERDQVLGVFLAPVEAV